MAEPALTRVTIKNATADEAIRLKDQLVQDGLIQGQDFSWAWDNQQRHPPVAYPVARVAYFDFADAALATFYQLKWT